MKYLLFKAEGADSGSRPCAFFNSEAGCRNGANCSFSHGATPTKGSRRASQNQNKVNEEEAMGRRSNKSKSNAKAKADSQINAKKAKTRDSSARKERQQRRAAMANGAEAVAPAADATGASEEASTAERLLQALGKLPEFEKLLSKAGLKGAIGAGETPKRAPEPVADDVESDEEEDDDDGGLGFKKGPAKKSRDNAVANGNKKQNKNDSKKRKKKDEEEEEEEEEEMHGLSNGVNSVNGVSNGDGDTSTDDGDEEDEDDDEISQVATAGRGKKTRIGAMMIDEDDDEDEDGEEDEDEDDDDEDEDEEVDGDEGNLSTRDGSEDVGDGDSDGPSDTTENATALANLASLGLPITPMRMGEAAGKVDAVDEDDDESDDASEDLPPGLRKWEKLRKKCSRHRKFETLFSFDTDSSWVRPREYGDWCKDLPQYIAIDCEMCGGKDPVTGEIDAKVLCRFSVVSGEGGKDVLIDTLVQPHMPVQDYRTDIHGITKEQLEGVPFTLRHAQAAMRSICSSKTIIIGHAVHNDLVSLRFAHDQIVDTALLYKLKGSERATPALRDISSTVIKQDMPEPHDSIIDARCALLGAEHLLNVKNIEEEAIVERAPQSTLRRKRRQRDGQSPAHKRRRQTNDPAALLVHRIPKTCAKRHLMKMFLRYAQTKPKAIDDIAFNASGQGKAFVTFESSEEASRTFDALNGDAVKDTSGREQKRVYLARGGYIHIRR